MRAMLATVSRELRAYFFSPLAYVVGALLLLVNGITFTIIVAFLSDPRSGGTATPLDYFFGQTIYFWVVLLFITPVITMRLISEERRSGTIETLMTAPITDGQVIVGKFLAALALYVVLWLPTLAYAGVLAYHSEVDWGPVAAGYLGILGIGSLFLSVGMFATAITRSQLVAAIFTFALLIPLFTFGLLEMLVNSEGWREVYGYLNLWRQMEDLGKGIVDTRALVYWSTATGLFLFLATRALAVRKWR